MKILRHIKTGGIYRQMLSKRDWRREADMKKMFAYESLSSTDPEVTNMIFLRPLEELTDGRFDALDMNAHDDDHYSTLATWVKLEAKDYRLKLRLIASGLVVFAFGFGFFIRGLI